jgi:thiosulfate/3-mercaptopyruvate sulfurtransferase
MTEYHTLIQVETVAERLGNPTWVLVDCGFDLADPDAGERAYREAHVPGAHYAHLDRDLAAPITPASGRHPLPDPETLAARLAAWGADEHSQLIAYDASGGAFAARLWWLSNWLGHDRVAVMDGGRQAWESAGLPLDAERPKAGQGNFEIRVRPNLAISTANLPAAMASGQTLIDARTPERFRGEVEPLDTKAGHVPGAMNHPFQKNLDASGRFLPADVLLERYARTLGGRTSDPVICMCGSGVTACHTLLALEIAGIEGGRLYAGSWSEWIRDPRREIATGA